MRNEIADTHARRCAYANKHAHGHTCTHTNQRNTPGHGNLDRARQMASVHRTFARNIPQLDLKTIHRWPVTTIHPPEHIVERGDGGVVQRKVPLSARIVAQPGVNVRERV